jgi:hypothetical protein
VRSTLFAAIAMLSACSFTDPASGAAPTDGNGGGSDTGKAPPDACQDDDGDGVCNVSDKCPGMDDTKDTDGDGIPDCLDDWPCGDKPKAPNRSIDNRVIGFGWKVDNTSLGGSNATLATITSGSTLNLSLTYTIGIGCGFGHQNCDAELKFGDDLDGVDGCVINQTFNNPDAASSNWNKDLTFKSVTQPTVFEIKLDLDGSKSCQLQWQGDTPGDKSTIAEVCITP